MTKIPCNTNQRLVSFLNLTDAFFNAKLFIPEGSGVTDAKFHFSFGHGPVQFLSLAFTVMTLPLLHRKVTDTDPVASLVHALFGKYLQQTPIPNAILPLS